MKSWWKLKATRRFENTTGTLHARTNEGIRNTDSTLCLLLLNEMPVYVPFETRTNGTVHIFVNPHASELRPFVITSFHASFDFRELLLEIGMRIRDYLVAFIHSPAIVQITLSPVKLCLSVPAVGPFPASGNEAFLQ